MLGKYSANCIRSHPYSLQKSLENSLAMCTVKSIISRLPLCRQGFRHNGETLMGYWRSMLHQSTYLFCKEPSKNPEIWRPQSLTTTDCFYCAGKSHSQQPIGMVMIWSYERKLRTMQKAVSTLSKPALHNCGSFWRSELPEGSGGGEQGRQRQSSWNPGSELVDAIRKSQHVYLAHRVCGNGDLRGPGEDISV